MLKQKYADPAALLADQWIEIHEMLLWYEEYNNEHDLWQHDGEADEDYPARVAKYFDDLKVKDPKKYEEDIDNYTKFGSLYLNVYEIEYSGEWGETFGDFFNPAAGDDYTGNLDVFLPLAAALSDGQRASLEILPLYTLIILGLGDEETIEELYPNIEEILKEEDEVSVYSGINRGIFRGGVALTSRALMEKNMGYDPYNNLWSFAGVYNIICYSMAIVGVVGMMAGISMMVAGKIMGPTAEFMRQYNSVSNNVTIYQGYVKQSMDIIKSGNYNFISPEEVQADLTDDLAQLNKYENELNEMQPAANVGVDKNAYNNEKLTASTFSTGHMALAGAGGLIIGVLVAVLIFISKKKKQVQE